MGQKIEIMVEGDPLISLQNRLHIVVCVFVCRVWRESFDKKVTCFPFRHPLETSTKPHS